MTAADHGAETFWELARAEQPSSAQQFIDELERELGGGRREGTR